MIGEAKANTHSTKEMRRRRYAKPSCRYTELEIVKLRQRCGEKTVQRVKQNK